MAEGFEGCGRSWGRRLLSTGRLAAAATRLAARRAMGAEGERDGIIGEALARELDEMKGMAMKVGQIVSYFDGILPEQAHAALRTLQRGTTPMATERIVAAIEQEFGAPIDRLFDSFDAQPIAAASIGQVHRARFRGRDVACKVQYPGIEATMAADFRRLESISRVASLATAVDGPALVNELRERIGEECDYRREARHQRDFAEAFRGNLRVVIPSVIDERSGARVLTTTWCEGLGFYEFVATASPIERNRVAELLVHFALHSLFGLGVINADPHPGNYLFLAEGRVAFLDFGCVRHFDAAWLDAQRELVGVVIEGRRGEFEAALLATGMVATGSRFDFDHHWALLRHEYAPYHQAGFRFDADWLRVAMEFSKPSNPNLRHLAIPPPWIWLERLIWGLHAVLVRLEADVDLRVTMRAALARS